MSASGVAHDSAAAANNPPWTVGDELEALRLPPVSRRGLIEYAGASGDHNPIHTDDEAAIGAGLQGIIQHGMLTMAQMTRLLTPYFEYGFIRSFSTRFTGMLFLDEAVVISAKVVGCTGTAFDFETRVRTADGRDVAKGKICFVWEEAATG